METLLLMLHPNEKRSQARKIPCLGQMEKNPEICDMVLCKIIQWLLEASQRFPKSEGIGKEKH